MQSIELRQVLQEQQLEARELRLRWKPREVTSRLQKLICSSKLIKVVMGIRRAGKSTLCLGAIPEGLQVSYVNFDDERLTGLTTKDLNQVYELLLELNPQTKVFIFDEIQNVESWELFVGRLHRKQINLLITGSNGKLLSRDLATHLTGRQISLELMPLSFTEFLEFNTNSILDPRTTEHRAILKNQLQKYFELGGFPEVVFGEPQGYYLRELFDKIIGRDISQRYRLRHSQTLKEMALYLIQQSGSITSIANLQESFGISSPNTVRTYFQYLQEVFLLYEVQGYSAKLKERSTRPKKYYACDLGLWSALNTKPTVDLGMRLETLVFLQLRRLNMNVFYLKDSGFDIDFCIVQDRKPSQLIQVCYSMQAGKTREREIKSLIAAARAYHLSSGTIVTWDESENFVEQGTEIDVVPAWKFLSFLAS